NGQVARVPSLPAGASAARGRAASAASAPGGNSTLAAGDPIPGVDISLEQIPGGISAAPRTRSANLRFLHPQSLTINGTPVSATSMLFKRIFPTHAAVAGGATIASVD